MGHQFVLHGNGYKAASTGLNRSVSSSGGVARKIYAKCPDAKCILDDPSGLPPELYNEKRGQNPSVTRNGRQFSFKDVKEATFFGVIRIEAGMRRKSKFEWLEWEDVLGCIGDLFSDEAGWIVLAAVLVIWGALWVISRMWGNFAG